MVPGASMGGAAPVRSASRAQEILSAQIQLLYANTSVAAVVSTVVGTTLGYLQREVVPHDVILTWWLFVSFVAVSRWVLAWSYSRITRGYSEITKWRTGLIIGNSLAGAGWGAAGFFLYPEGQLANQVILLFVLGGVMLGAASLTAPRPEAFLTFMIPTGLGPAARLFLHGDEPHSGMGMLVVVFTIATLTTTWRIYRTIDSSLRLKFENRELVEDLKAVRDQTAALNQALEIRVQERTNELEQSTQLLRAEIQQRQQMEEDLVRARKLESLAVLAGGIAHDFNNFLTIVQGNAEEAKKVAGDAAQDLLDQAISTCGRAAFLSSQLLTFAKGGAPVRRLVSIAKLIMDSVDLARAGNPISIAVDIPEDLRYAEVDPDQIGQVLHNILINARQAMPDGGIIEVRAGNLEFPNSLANEPWIRISIRDYGCGIPADVIARIFDPYFTTKQGGSGLGLATAHSIVSKHNGHISVESNPGIGTIFTVELPASLERPAPEVLVARNVQTGSERILVMDDEEALLKLIERILTSLGYEVDTAREGAEAIAIYEAAQASGRPFDAVLLDLTVSGGMGGVETAAKLKAKDPSSKLIVSSGYSDTSAMSDFGKFGFDARIPKPWTSAQISEVLRSVLNSDRAARSTPQP
jgi:signal transduction histidine kinase/ActR/RegA family two-component response regulator